MDNFSILTELRTDCSFPEAFSEKTEQNGMSEYRSKIGHIRADYNGYRWWNTIWPCHTDLLTPEISKEIDWLYEQLTSQNAFVTLSAMTQFCYEHPQACVDSLYHTEYNFYYTGKHCNFWIRCITRSNDYNLYVHAFTK